MGRVSDHSGGLESRTLRIKKRVSFPYLTKMRFIGAGILLLGILGCSVPERNCTDFRNGTFTFESVLDGELVITTFERTDTLEIDHYLGRKDSAHVRWINECEFVVTKLHPTTRNEQRPVHMKILTTSTNSYTFEYSLVGDLKNKRHGTAKKIK